MHKNDKFEIHVEDFGKCLFSLMTKPETNIPFWESIRAEAEPLVRKLLELGERKYRIHGYTKENGEKVLSKSQMVLEAQYKHLRFDDVSTETLKVGTRIFYSEDEEDVRWLEIYTVEAVCEKGIYATSDRSTRIDWSDKEFILKVPDDWEDEEKYETDEYWLSL